MSSHFIGLMSGTSLDGVDGVLGLIDAAHRRGRSRIVEPVRRRSCTVNGSSGSFASLARSTTIWVTRFRVAFDMQRLAS